MMCGLFYLYRCCSYLTDGGMLHSMLTRVCLYQHSLVQHNVATDQFYYNVNYSFCTLWSVTGIMLPLYLAEQSSLIKYRGIYEPSNLWVKQLSLTWLDGCGNKAKRSGHSSSCLAFSIIISRLDNCYWWQVLYLVLIGLCLTWQVGMSRANTYDYIHGFSEGLSGKPVLRTVIHESAFPTIIFM